jgi:hypothetical protein
MARVSAVGRSVLRLVVGALCVAAAVAIGAIVSGDFSEGDVKVIGTSLLFAVASSTAGAGAALRLRGGDADVGIGSLVIAASVAAFVMVTLGIWTDIDSDGFWRTTGVLGIVALDGAHAGFVLARRRAADSQATETATTVTVLAATLSGALGILAVTDLVESDNWEVLAVVLVVQLAGTALAPVLRRLGEGGTAPEPALRGDPTDIAAELRAIADALEKAPSPSAVRVEADRLRRLARQARTK